MKLFGFWPRAELNIWKAASIFFFDLLINTLPSVKYLVGTIERNDRRSLALVVPEVLINLLHTAAMIIFICNIKLIKAFLEKLEIEWFRDKSSEWQLIQNTSMRFSNRVSILSHFCMHLTGLFYFFIPQCIFISKFYIMNDELIGKQTIMLVE